MIKKDETQAHERNRGRPAVGGIQSNETLHQRAVGGLPALLHGGVCRGSGHSGDGPALGKRTTARRGDAACRRRGVGRTPTAEILDYGTDELEYWEILYDRIPTLPQSLHRDFGVLPHLWQNIAQRVARTTK